VVKQPTVYTRAYRTACSTRGRYPPLGSPILFAAHAHLALPISTYRAFCVPAACATCRCLLPEHRLPHLPFCLTSTVVSLLPRHAETLVLVPHHRPHLPHLHSPPYSVSTAGAYFDLPPKCHYLRCCGVPVVVDVCGHFPPTGFITFGYIASPTFSSTSTTTPGFTSPLQFSILQ